MSQSDARMSWKGLASQFDPAFVRLNATKIAPTPSAIVLKAGEDSKVETDRFVASFMEAMKDDVRAMQVAATAAASALGPSTVYIDDEATKVIAPIIERMRAPIATPEPSTEDTTVTNNSSAKVEPLCTHPKQEKPCSCSIPLWTRQLTWLSDADDEFMRRGYRWYSEEDNYALDYCHAMLLDSELLPSLVRAQPLVVENSLGHSSVHRGYTYYELQGQLRRIYEMTLGRAMLPFLALSILRVLPETWDADAKREPWHDYRDTVLYQTMIATACAGTVRRHGEMSCFPHNSFFDVPDFGWPLMPWVQKGESRIPNKLLQRGLQFGKETMVGRGKLPFDKFVASRKGVRRRLKRGERDVDEEEARTALGRRGLPNEVVDAIIDMADEEGQPWRLVVKDDPLHPANRKVLDSYLEYCWKLLARCWVGLHALDGHDAAATYMERMVREAVEVLGCGKEHCTKHLHWCSWCTLVS